MDSFKLKQALEERNEALRSLDLVKLAAYYKKYNPGMPLPALDVLECGMHKARTACLALTREERQLSKRWLTERGYESLDDGDLNDSAAPGGTS